MNPGRELDALVAEKVMGYRLKRDDCNTFWVDQRGDEPDHSHDYSTDIAAAMEVAQKVYGYSRLYTFDVWTIDGGETWGAEFITSTTIKEWGDTAPHAICLAALKAVGAL